MFPSLAVSFSELDSWDATVAASVYRSVESFQKACVWAARAAWYGIALQIQLSTHIKCWRWAPVVGGDNLRSDSTLRGSKCQPSTSMRRPFHCAKAAKSRHFLEGVADWGRCTFLKVSNGIEKCLVHGAEKKHVIEPLHQMYLWFFGASAERVESRWSAAIVVQCRTLNKVNTVSGSW